MLPLLALIPGLLYTGAKYVGPVLEDHSKLISKGLIDILEHSPTGSKLVGVFENVLGPINEDKKLAFTLELDSMLGQVDIDKVEAQSESRFDSGWRPFIGWVCGLSLCMSILVEPTVDYLAGWFNTIAPPIYVLSPLVMSLICGLCGIYMVGRTVEKSKGVN